jgi:hypothetical protein
LTKSYSQFLNSSSNNIPTTIQYLFKRDGGSGVNLGSASGLIDLFQRVSRGQVIHAVKTLDAKIAGAMRKEDAW